jgi:uncharacterized membrane protein (UPF0127 family)
VAVNAWIADNDPRRHLGLMYVKSLPPDRGMLFIFPRAKRLGFWMHNTLIPLSIAYIREDGVIGSICDMEALDEHSHPSTCAVRFALEMTKGWFAAHKIEPGVRVDGIVDLPGYDE